jgi:hypothetical protein
MNGRQRRAMRDYLNLLRNEVWEWYETQAKTMEGWADDEHTRAVRTAYAQLQERDLRAIDHTRRLLEVGP